MLQMKSILNVADNSGARKASIIGVLHAKGRRQVFVGDMVRVNIKEVSPDSPIKKGAKAKGIVVRTKAPVRRADGTYVRFDSNALVIVDDAGNPKGTRIFGPVVRELRNLDYMKIISLAPEVV